MTYIKGLFRMADGGAGDGGAANGGAAASGVTPQDAAAGNSGVTQPDAAASNRSQRRNPLSGVQYGTQRAAQQPAQGKAPQQQDDAAQWQEAKTRYKAQYDADVQQIVRGRLKDAETNQQSLETLKPMLDAMARQYGLKEGDHQALVDKFLDSDSLYEEESLRTGTPVAALKQIKKLQERSNQQEQQLSRFTEQAQAEQHIRGLVTQAEALRQKYPMFDLQKEMQNEQFVRMTSPNGGLTVEQAFAALHHNELQQYAMQAAAQQTRRQATETMQANMARPRENAGRAPAPAAQVKASPKGLKAADFREIARRTNAGEVITFD